MAATFIIVQWVFLYEIALRCGYFPSDLAFAWDMANPLFQFRAVAVGHVAFYLFDCLISDPSSLRRKVGALEQEIARLRR